MEKGKATIEDAKKMLADLDQDIEDRGKIGASKQQLDQREAILKYIEALEIMGIAEEQATQKSNSFVGGFVNGLKEIQSNLPTLAEEGKKFATSFETGLTGAFDSIIDGTKSVGDALKDFGKMLLKQAIKCLFLDQF